MPRLPFISQIELCRFISLKTIWFPGNAMVDIGFIWATTIRACTAEQMSLVLLLKARIKSICVTWIECFGEWKNENGKQWIEQWEQTNSETLSVHLIRLVICSLYGISSTQFEDSGWASVTFLGTLIVTYCSNQNHAIIIKFFNIWSDFRAVGYI